jgi:hypothetical protein
MMRYRFHEQGNAPRDWPSERFESLWRDVAAASGSGAFTAEAVGRLPVVAMPDWSNPPLDAWVCVDGRLEQRAPLGSLHSGGEEWFVRGVSGVPVAAYVMDAPQAQAGERVRVVGRVIGPLRLADRRGEMREYSAVIGKAVVNADGSAAVLVRESGGIGGGASWPLVSGGAVLLLLVAWFVLRRLLRQGGGVSAIHAAASAARVGGGRPASRLREPTDSSGGRA